MRRKKRTTTFWLVLLFVLFLLTSCGKSLPIVSEAPETKAYSRPETMIIVATERNRYQKLFTNQIWGIQLPDGSTFETYLLSQVREFIQEMKTLNLLAEAKGIAISGTEQEKLKKFSKEYYDSLTKEDIAYMGVSREDVETIAEQYYLSNKVVYELTKDMDLEISDSEAKVITVGEIVLSDPVTAEEVRNKVMAEGAVFENIAKEYSEEEFITRQIGRGEAPGAVEDAVFSLAVGEVSPVVEEDGTYRIFQCISDYDEDATQARKESLYLERKKEAFGSIYDEFKAANPITFSDEVWKDITFSNSDKTTTTNFFELYRTYFPE